MAETTTPKAAPTKRAAPTSGAKARSKAPAEGSGTTAKAAPRASGRESAAGPRETAPTPRAAGRPIEPSARSTAPRRPRATSAAAAGGLDRSGASHGHSAVEALLAEHSERSHEQVAALHPLVANEAAQPARSEPTRSQPARSEPTRSEPTRSESTPGRVAPMATARAPRRAPAAAQLPPAEDVLLGLASVVAENAWRIGSAAVAAISGAANQAVAFVRGVAPGYASAQADAHLNALAERGRRVREERTEALGAAMTSAITSAATSDAVREMTVAAIEEATDDVLAVMLPAVLEAVTELETQERLDELMAGLLLRQLPSALEKTLPGVMIRTATRPALGLMPFLGGALPRGQQPTA